MQRQCISVSYNFIHPVFHVSSTNSQDSYHISVYCDDNVVVYAELWQGEVGVEAQQIFCGEFFCGEFCS